MRNLVLNHEVMTSTELDAMLSALLSAQLVGDSQLRGTFRGSRGFGVAFTTRGRERVLERFRFLGPFLNALDDKAGAWFRAASLAPANAFYLNCLILHAEQKVGPHIDGTLSDPAGVEGLTPDLVSALYLQAPSPEAGGELVLRNGPLEVARVRPVVGQMVHFRGDLVHEVTPTTSGTPPRVSLVCEQYVLTPSVLERLAPITLQSRAVDPVFASVAPTKTQSFEALLRRREAKK